MFKVCRIRQFKLPTKKAPLTLPNFKLSLWHVRACPPPCSLVANVAARFALGGRFGVGRPWIGHFAFRELELSQ